MAQELYNIYCDMDYNDHAETYDNDIYFINELLDLYGLETTKQILDNYFER